MPGPPGHVDAAHAVSLLAEPVHDAGPHADLVDVHAVGAALLDRRHHPARQLHSVQFLESLDILHSVAPPPKDDTAVGAEAGHVYR